MIEKVMRAVKSNNKKRGRNITIGAVVGMLLSCSVVIKADVIGLEIGKENDAIILKDGNGNKFDPKRSEGNPYPDNKWDIEKNTYTNNSIIIGEATTSEDDGIGIKLSGELKVNLTNNGAITGYSYGSGIVISTLTVNLTNNGIITNYGPYSGYGIVIQTLTGNLTNTGVVYGKTNAIKISHTGTIKNAYNYGLLVSGKTIINEINGGKVTTPNNYGLAFKVDELGKYSAKDESDDSDFSKFGTKQEVKDTDYIVINAKAIGGNTDIEGTESLTLKDGSFSYLDSKDSEQTESISPDKKYILNGITDTLEVKGTGNKLNNSVINAYKTAVVMKGESNLTLENTVVNGGIDETSPAILVTENNNFLTISGDSIVNGDMKADGEKNTLNLYGKQNMTRSSESESMNILYYIEGFGRIQIENDVTFFENIKVTGVERLNINKGGTLNLRLNAGTTLNNKATHALSVENTGLLIAGKEEEGSENAGTLNFITNGMGTGTVIGMEGIELENVFLRANSILYDLEVVDTEDVGVAAVGDIKLDVGASLSEIYNERAITFDPYPKYKVIPNEVLYTSLNKIYQSSVKTSNNVNAITDMIASASDEEQWEKLLTFLGGIYTESPYSYSSELSRRSTGMFRDIITENEFRPNLNNWLIMGGLTHADGGTKDTYYGKNYYKIDSGSSTTNAEMKLTGAYMLAKYGYSENTSLGLTLGGNKSEAKLSMSKVKGNSGYLGAFAENYRGNLTLKAGAGVQYSEYDADRSTLGGHSYSDKYSDMTYDIYLNGRYSHQVGDNLFLEPYATLSYTYVDQDGANEGSKVLAIETDSKSFDYTVGKVGVDLKKVIPHEKGKSTLTAGVSYTKILDGAEEEYITGRFKGGSDFDILVAHKNEHSIGLNAKYALELENGVLFDVKGTYSVERDSHNGSGKNKTKGEWIVGAGMGYKF
ncbi:autotransporter outer membrane beta-barrel domain-containing protein [Fusobacterium ulcerans]|uniref:autotransporter family protein n=1 Tax=Fusobacterium ulcerans TaxID=861 RepID=UPI002E790E9D|nr:autotransporter outer membrane beta-barrel domain-containing protein [Fusobacterium ulcerans]MEE0139582.1 autotransporter outer membrane beta-barrel domain-containing protein [Fusobacterium ulcerans]